MSFSVLFFLFLLKSSSFGMSLWSCLWSCFSVQDFVVFAGNRYWGIRSWGMGYWGIIRYWGIGIRSGLEVFGLVSGLVWDFSFGILVKWLWYCDRVLVHH